MNPFWLTFRNPAMERAYNADQIRRVLRRADAAYVRVALCVATAGLVRSILTGGGLLHRLAWAASATNSVWEMYSRKGMSTEDLMSVRTKLVCIRRTAQMLINCLLVPGDATLVPDNPLALLFKANLLSSTVLSLNLRLNFALHMPYQFMFTFFSITFATREPCRVAMTTSLGPWITSLNETMTLASDLFVGMAGGPPVIQHTPPKCSCLYIVVWAHVFVMTMLVPLTLWMQERASRVAFIHTLPHAHRTHEDLDSITDISQCGFFFYFLVCASIVGAGWKVTSIFVRLA